MLNHENVHQMFSFTIIEIPVVTNLNCHALNSYRVSFSVAPTGCPCQHMVSIEAVPSKLLFTCERPHVQRETNDTSREIGRKRNSTISVAGYVSIPSI